MKEYIQEENSINKRFNTCIIDLFFFDKNRQTAQNTYLFLFRKNIKKTNSYQKIHYFCSQISEYGNC